MPDREEIYGPDDEFDIGFHDDRITCDNCDDTGFDDRSGFVAGKPVGEKCNCPAGERVDNGDL